MTRIHRSVRLAKDPEQVVNYISDVQNHPAFISALTSISNLSGDSHRPGTTWSWSFVMAGIEIEGSAETTKFEPGKVFAYKTTSGVESQFSYRVEAGRDGNDLVVEVNYEPPQGVLGRVVDKALIERQNEAEADRTIANLKAIFSD